MPKPQKKAAAKTAGARKKQSAFVTRSKTVFPSRRYAHGTAELPMRYALALVKRAYCAERKKYFRKIAVSSCTREKNYDIMNFPFYYFGVNLPGWFYIQVVKNSKNLHITFDLHQMIYPSNHFVLYFVQYLHLMQFVNQYFSADYRNTNTKKITIFRFHNFGKNGSCTENARIHFSGILAFSTH